MSSSKWLFRAIHYNWGLIGPCDWEKTYWTVYADGTVLEDIRYRPDCDGKRRIIRKHLRFSEEAFAQLSQLLSTDFVDACTNQNGCDGEAWEMTTYNENEEVTHHIPIGYIYDSKPLCRIENLLEKMDHYM